MSGTCVIPGCNRTRGQHYFEDDGCTPLNFFSFKSACDTKIDDWIRASGRNDLTVNNCASKAICSMHFSPNDIMGNRHTKGKLKHGAVPSRNLSLLSSENVKYTYYLVKDNVASSGSTDICISPHPMLIVNSLASPSVGASEADQENTTSTSLHPIRNVNSLVPQWHYEQRSGMTWYYQLSSANNTPPRILRSVKVPSDGSFPEFYMGGEKWQHLRAKRLVRKALLNRCIFHKNGFVRVLTEFGKVPFAEIDSVQSAVNALVSVLNNRTQELGVVDDGNDNKVFLSFIVEQLRMLSEKNSVRRWSPDVMKWAASIYHHSTTAYRLLCGSGYLLLPCQRRINGHYKAAGLPKTRPSNNLKDTLQCVV